MNNVPNPVPNPPVYLSGYNLIECLEEMHLITAIPKLSEHSISTFEELYPIIYNAVVYLQAKTSLSLIEISLLLKMFDLISYGNNPFMHKGQFRAAKQECINDEHWQQKRKRGKEAMVSHPDNYLKNMKPYSGGLVSKHEKVRFLVLLRATILDYGRTTLNNQSKSPVEKTGKSQQEKTRTPTFLEAITYENILPWDKRIEKYIMEVGYNKEKANYDKSTIPVMFKIDVIQYMESRSDLSFQRLASMLKIRIETLQEWWGQRETLKCSKDQELSITEILNNEHTVPYIKRDQINPDAVFKMKVLEYSKSHSVRETADYCQIARGTVSRWKSQKEQIEAECERLNKQKEEINRRMSSKREDGRSLGGRQDTHNMKMENVEEAEPLKAEGSSACTSKGIVESHESHRTHYLTYISHHALKAEEYEESSNTKSKSKSIKCREKERKAKNRRRMPPGVVAYPNFASLSVEKRWLIVFLKKYLWEYEFSLREIGFIMNISLSTATSYWTFYSKYGTVDVSRIPKSYKWKPDETMCEAIKSFMDEKNERGEMPIARDVLFHLKELGFPPITSEALRSRYLRKIGYTWKRVQPTIANKENRGNQLLRGKYLEALMKNREGARREEVFLDESYVKDIHHRANCWVKKNEQNTVILPKSNHQMVCIVGAINYLGWIGVNYPHIQDQLRASVQKGVYSYGSIKYFKYENKEQSDYHHSFTIPFFSHYFQHNLLPGLNEPSLIIMDRVSYHVHLVGGVLEIRKASKQELLERLLEKGIKFRVGDKIEDLRKMLLREEGNKTFCEEKAEELGHQVLYLPPYHPEFNPIELAWSFIKRRVGSNPKYNIHYICQQQLPEAFYQFKGERAYNLIRHTDGIIQATLTDPHLSLPKKTVKYNRKDDATFIERVSPDSLIWGTYKD